MKPTLQFFILSSTRKTIVTFSNISQYLKYWYSGFYTTALINQPGKFHSFYILYANFPPEFLTGAEKTRHYLQNGSRQPPSVFKIAHQLQIIKSLKNGIVHFWKTASKQFWEVSASENIHRYYFNRHFHRNHIPYHWIKLVYISFFFSIGLYRFSTCKVK